MITEFGYDTFFKITGICVLAVAIALIVVEPVTYRTIIITSAIIIFGFTSYFFRDPERNTPQKGTLIISPADGKVLQVQKIKEREFFNDDVWQVSIFMSPLNVHVNRSPISGTVKYKRYKTGKFKMAFGDGASIENEQMVIGIEGEYGKVLFRQIAGFLARRIVCILNEGDKTLMGERIGMIKFGSRLDVVFPLHATPLVKVGDKTIAGVTVIGEFQNTIKE